MSKIAPAVKDFFNTLLSRIARRPLLSLSLIYLCVALLFCWQLLCPGFSFYRWDTLLYSWPLFAEARQQILSGNIPFWSSSVCCGTDMLGNINIGILYPLKALIWFLPLQAGYNIFLFIHIWLTLMSMHYFLRKCCGLSLFAAFAGSIAFAFSGYSRAMWDSVNFVALPWIPLGFAAMMHAVSGKKESIMAILGIAGCSAMMILGGDFQAAAVWVIAAGLLALCMKERWRLLAVLTSGAAVAALLTAPQTLTTYNLMTASAREGGLSFAEATELSFHPFRLIELAIPHIFGTHEGWFARELFADDALKLSPWTASFHIGSFSLLAVLLSWRYKRNRFAVFSAVLLIIALLLSFGRLMPGFAAWLKVPVIGGFRYPEKYLLWATFALSVLCGFGAEVIADYWKRTTGFRTRLVTISLWALAAGAIHAAGSTILSAVSNDNPFAPQWAGARTMSFLILCAAAVTATLVSRRFKTLLIPASLFIINMLIPWYIEKPMTNRLNPLKPLPAAAVIKYSSNPFGRVMRDPAVAIVPLPKKQLHLPPHVRKAINLPARLAYNSPRAWGLRSTDGFSPLESARMNTFRKTTALPDRGIPDVRDFADFCSLTSSAWILTTSERASTLTNSIPRAKVHSAWGSKGETVLLRVADAKEARFINRGNGAAGKVTRLMRLRPNTIRVDIKDCRGGTLFISETYSKGWKAVNGIGDQLTTMVLNDAFLGVTVPPGTIQVRLTYTPIGWTTGCILFALGFVATALIALFLWKGRLIPLIKSPATAISVSCLIFTLLGLSARNRWACTYDEGFHLARGLGRIMMNDSRLNYYHPPLQNMICGQFAYLAYGDQIRFPQALGWKDGDIQRFATEFANANRKIYPGLIRASRWGSMLFGLLFCIVGVHWAGKAGGVVAAWVASFCFAFHPNILAHANLTTTDAGVSAMVLTASYVLWQYCKSDKLWKLFLAGFLFALASVLKFTGLVWMLSLLLIAMPLICAKSKSARPLIVIPFTLAAFLIMVLVLYNFDNQLIRAAGPFSGKKIIAGRYIEGLFRQGAHILEGHRAYFAGEQFNESSFKHMPLNIIVKHPLLWIIAAAASLGWWITSIRKDFLRVIPFIPLGVFAIMFMTANKLALGIRHLMPILPFIVVAFSVMLGNLRKSHILQGVLSASIAGAAVVAVVQSYPYFLSYYPLWAGGLNSGHYWSVDSNFDWGQDLEELESRWAAATRANRGRPPHLLYFGFLDPRVIYGLDVTEPGYGGYMQLYSMSRSNRQDYMLWRESLAEIDGTTVSSISLLKLRPFGIDFEYITDRKELGRIAPAYYIHTE